MDTEQRVTFVPTEESAAKCSHLDQITIVTPSSVGCQECIDAGDTWVHLRMCMTCGYIGCCDSSKNKHASKHFAATGHPIIRSAEPGETWGWCYIDEVLLKAASPEESISGEAAASQKTS
ncbi:MAG: UBP-type zinc finger domain-containing protein [Bacteroidota bacterium]